MRIEQLGTRQAFLGGAFINNGALSAMVAFAGPSLVLLRNAATGFETTLTGTGFSGSSLFDLQGTITSIETRADGQVQGRVSGMSWSAAEFVAALSAVVTSGNLLPLADLSSRFGPLEFDASAGLSSMDMLSDFDFWFDLGVPVIATGSAQDDYMMGTFQDDVLVPGAGDNLVLGSPGADAISFAGADADTFNTVRFGLFTNGVQFRNDPENNQAFIETSMGITTLTSVNAALLGGLRIDGTRGDDQLSLTLRGDQSGYLVGLQGVDTYTLDLEQGALGSLGLGLGWNGAPTQGVVVDLSRGLILNDGFGNREAVFLMGDGTGRIEVFGTALNDSIMGSGISDIFLATRGDDSFDGGAGRDQVTYDEDWITSVSADLALGRAEKLIEGAMSRDTFANVEHLIGTTTGDDTLRGSAGDDEIEGGGGNDRIYGHAGADTLDGQDGNDRIFADGLQAVYAQDAAARVFRLYQATLDRAPDRQGQINWVDRLENGERSLAQVAQGFVDSDEFAADYGTLSDAAFVDLLYRNVLNRAPDTAGLADWSARLLAGATRAEVVTGFSESAEFTAASRLAAADYARMADPREWTDEVFRLYQATLDRAPDEAGLLDWSGRLAAGRTLSDVIAGFTESAEFRAAYNSLTDTAFVQLLYRNVLDRTADSAGLADWTGRLAAGTTRAEVVRGFSESAEFIANSRAPLEAWMRAQGTDDVITGGAGNDRLAGGQLSDVFVFDAANDGTDRVLDLEAWDTLRFTGFGYASDADIRAHLTQDGADVRFADQGVTVVLLNTQLAQITDAMLEAVA